MDKPAALKAGIVESKYFDDDGTVERIPTSSESGTRFEIGMRACRGNRMFDELSEKNQDGWQ